MKTSRTFSALTNERIAVREQRIMRRDEVRNERRSGLSAIPLPEVTGKFDQSEMTRICEALRCSRASNMSVSDLRTLKELLLHPAGIPAFMKDRGALHGLVGELCGKRAIHQLEAAYICVNLALGEEQFSLPVCRAAGSYFVQFLEGSSFYLQEASAWAIGNLAGTSSKCGAVLCSQGAVLQLIQLLSGPQKGLSLAAAYALCLIIHAKTVLQKDELHDIARHSPLFVSTEPDFCVLLYLLSCIPECEEIMLNERIVTRTVTLLADLIRTEEDPDAKPLTALLRTVGNLTSGVGALELIGVEEVGHLLCSLLNSPHKHLCKEVAWICANLLHHENQNVCDFAALVGLPGAMSNLVATHPAFASA